MKYNKCLEAHGIDKKAIKEEVSKILDLIESKNEEKGVLILTKELRKDVIINLCRLNISISVLYYDGAFKMTKIIYDLKGAPFWSKRTQNI